MLNREWIYQRLRDGFWVPWLITGINFMHEAYSINRIFNRWLTAGRRRYVYTSRHGISRHGIPQYQPKGAAGGSELYLAVTFGLGVFWFFSVGDPLPPTPINDFLRASGIVIFGYFIAEFAIFLLHWMIVARTYLRDLRRSLILFTINIPQLAVFFGIVLNLANCYKSPMGPWKAIVVNLRSLGSVLFKGQIESVPVSDSLHCAVISHSQTAIGTVLILLIIVNLAASIIRPDLGSRPRN